MNDLQHARATLERGGYTCVLCRDDETLTDSRRGVKPLLELLESGKDYTGFSAADKVVGKAAAHLYCLLGIRAIYAGVISEPAKRVLESEGIQTEYAVIVPAIRNRTNTGLCPMESAVWELRSHTDAHRAITDTLNKLQNP